jgi:hypothetical protein
LAEDFYRVEAVHGSELSFPVHKREALDQLSKRMELERIGEPLRVVRLRYRLDPEGPPPPFTLALRRVWRSIVTRFPDVGSLGTFACKADSQHAVLDGTANAADWSAALTANTDAKLIAYLWDVFDYSRRLGMLFEQKSGRDGDPISEVIFRDKITTRAQDWTVRPYTGTFHATHVHTSAFPLLRVDPGCQ